jgi:hypothetical protein
MLGHIQECNAALEHPSDVANLLQMTESAARLLQQLRPCVKAEDDVDSSLKTLSDLQERLANWVLSNPFPLEEDFNSAQHLPRAPEEGMRILPVVGLPVVQLEQRPRRFFDLAYFPLISSSLTEWVNWFKTELLSGRQECLSKLVGVPIVCVSVSLMQIHPCFLCSTYSPQLVIVKV